MSATNPYERAGRLRKVLNMLALIPCGHDAAANGRVADVLAEVPLEWRAALARKAGVNPPSDETWIELVAAVRARKGAKDDPFARVGLGRNEAANDNVTSERNGR